MMGYILESKVINLQIDVSILLHYKACFYLKMRRHLSCRSVHNHPGLILYWPGLEKALLDQL